MRGDAPDRPEGYAAIDHTADRGLRAWGADLEALFRQAALGLAAMLTDPATVRRRHAATIEVSGIDLEELLISWLGEILYRHESDGLLLAGCDELRITPEAGGFRLRARVAGEPRDPARHPAGAPVKAATYHNLRIAPDENGLYEVTIIFDT